MSSKQQHANLERLLHNITSARPIGAPHPAAVRHSRALPWAHSTSRLSLRRICKADGFVAAKHAAKTTEALVGTQGCVFFYIGMFQYPSTECGFLLGHSMEGKSGRFEAALPFDSGGLLHHFLRPKKSGSARSFREQHDLPAPEYRRYLAEVLSRCFVNLGDYLDGSPPSAPDPHGLRPRGPDNPRRWTFEYRRQGTVPLKSSLAAVFLPRAVAADREVKPLLAWCTSNGVHWEHFTGGRKGNFTQLQRAARAHLRKVCGA